MSHSANYSPVSPAVGVAEVPGEVEAGAGLEDGPRLPGLHAAVPGGPDAVQEVEVQVPGRGVLQGHVSRCLADQEAGYHRDRHLCHNLFNFNFNSF